MINNNIPRGVKAKASRRLAAALALVTLCAIPSVQAQSAAQAYPNRPIRIVVGFPPGGSSDATARLLGAALSTKLGQPVVIDNKPGANTVIATQYARSQPADGYTLLAASASFAINPSLQKLNYNIKTDFVPVAMLGTIPLVLVTSPQVPAKSVAELMTAGKSGNMSYASYGAGGAGHIATELMLSMTGAEMVHVPYKGSGPALVDVMGNQVPLMMATVTASISAIKDGKLKALAVTSGKRPAVLPNTPTVAESGLSGYELIEWETIQAPAGTPVEIVNKLNAAIREVIAKPEFREKLTGYGIEADTGKSSAEVAKFIQNESDKFARIIQSRNIKPQ